MLYVCIEMMVCGIQSFNPSSLLPFFPPSLPSFTKVVFISCTCPAVASIKTWHESAWVTTVSWGVGCIASFAMAYILNKAKRNAMDLMKNDFLCQICGDILADPHMPSSGCDHKYCYTCIKKSLKKANQCPVCRLPLQPRELARCHKLAELLKDFNTMNEAFVQIVHLTAAEEEQAVSSGGQKKSTKDQRLVQEDESTALEVFLDPPNGSPVDPPSPKISLKQAGDPALGSVRGGYSSSNDGEVGKSAVDDNAEDIRFLKEELSREEREIEELRAILHAQKNRTAYGRSDETLFSRQGFTSMQTVHATGCRVAAVAGTTTLAEEPGKCVPQLRTASGGVGTDVELTPSPPCPSPTPHTATKPVPKEGRAVTTPRELVFAVSQCTADDVQTLVGRFIPWASEQGFGQVRFDKMVTPETTHLLNVPGKGGKGSCRRTMKFFRAVAVRAWVLDVRWIYACLESKLWVDEEDFEFCAGDMDPAPKLSYVDSRSKTMLMGGARMSRMARFPRASCHHMFADDAVLPCFRSTLLDGYTLYVYRDFSAVKLKTTELTELIRLSGGTAMSYAQLQLLDRIEEKDRQNCFLICPMKGMMGSIARALQEGHKIRIVTHNWLLDSVSANELQDVYKESYCTVERARCN